MRVRALKTFASPGGVRQDGDEFDLGEAQAVDWIKAGLVQRVPEEPRTAVRPAPEMAVRRK
jgi:hypothetical protein